MTSERPLARSLEDLRPLHQLCREGRLYEVERWIAEGKPLQLTPEAIHKSARPKTALEIALETGQHSLVSALLRSGYRLELERYRPLDLALKERRWDLFDLLLEAGGDLKSVEVYTVLNTYNVELYERFRAAGSDLTEGHEMGAVLGHGTSNRPLLGFIKRHRAEDPKLQTELNIALGYHARAGNERGVALCLWAGADPHAPAPDPDFRVTVSPGSGEEDENPFVGWSAVEEAATAGHLEILKRLGPDPARDDFDHLYQFAKSESVIAHLATIQLPKDLTSALSWHLRWMVDPFPLSVGRGSGTVEKLLTCGVRWAETDPKKLAQIRGSLVKAREDELRSIFRYLKRPEICAPETLQELIRTPKMRERLLAFGLLKKPVNQLERRHVPVRGPASTVGPSLDHPVDTDRRLPRSADVPGELRPVEESLGVARLSRCYDRETLYDQVWSQPVQLVAKSYGVSGVALAKTCRRLQIPVPPRGYWARIRTGHKVRRPPLPGVR
jgi:hypothetical protein